MSIIHGIKPSFLPQSALRSIQTPQASTAQAKRRQDTLVIQNKLRVLQQEPLAEQKPVEEKQRTNAFTEAIQAVMQHCSSDIPQVAEAAYGFLSALASIVGSRELPHLKGNLPDGFQDPVTITIPGVGLDAAGEKEAENRP